MTNITLSGIYLYPIKSAAGIALQSAQVAKRGFQHDRRWMLVDNNGKFLSQRQFPRLALIRVQLTGEHLIVSAPDREPLSIPIEPNNSNTIPVQIWRDVCEAIPLGETCDRWFSDVIDTSCRLVYMPDKSHRPINSKYANPKEEVSFADSFPFLLISEATLADLNQRLAEPISMNRFRPNLVVSGCEAFAEDSWQRIRIGSIPFRVVKACERCTITTVDQATGIRGKEPLVTLAKYRLEKGKILFGQNLIQEELGRLQLGDTVEVETLASV